MSLIPPPPSTEVLLYGEYGALAAEDAPNAKPGPEAPPEGMGGGV